jgi:hypothetical protein
MAELKPHLEQIRLVCAGIDQGLEPPGRDHAGVHVNLRVWVDQRLVAVHHDRFEKRHRGDRSCHPLHEVDLVLFGPPLPDLSVRCPGDLLDGEVP